MGRPERSLFPALRLKAGGTDRGDAGGLQCFAITQFRQQAWQAAGQQRFAGAGRSTQQQTMRPGCGYFQGAPGLLLTAYIAQVWSILGAERTLWSASPEAR